MKHLLKNLVVGLALAESLIAAPLVIKQADSQVEFTATGRPGGFKIVGKSTGEPFSGKLNVDKENITGQVSFQLATLDTGMDLRNSHLKDNYLEVAKFPTAKFELKETKFEGTGSEREGTFKGTMDLHGVKKEVTGKVTLNQSGSEAKLAFAFEVELADYQIAIPSFAGVKVDSRVPVKVVINGNLTPVQG